MKPTLAVTSVLFASVLCLPPGAAAQGPVKTFDQLNSRLKVGNTIRVIDTEGREIKGKVTELHNASITVDSGAPATVEANRVHQIQSRTKSYRSFVLGGMAAGAAFGALGGIVTADEVPGAQAVLSGALWCGIGAGVGAIVRAAVPAAWQEVYRAPGASGSARVSVAPMVKPRAKGVVLSVSF